MTDLDFEKFEQRWARLEAQEKVDRVLVRLAWITLLGITLGVTALLIAK